jgi:hypothetical protein
MVDGLVNENWIVVWCRICCPWTFNTLETYSMFFSSSSDMESSQHAMKVIICLYVIFLNLTAFVNVQSLSYS